MNQEILKKLPQENEAQYIFRLGQLKDSGIITETWENINPTINRELNIEEENWRDVSSFRKRYRNYLDAYEQIFSKERFVDERIADINSQMHELYKIKKQAQDQRRELRNLLTPEARFNNLIEALVDSANRLCEEKPLGINDYVVKHGDKEAVLALADWHYGMVTDNIWNKYNTDICRQRVKQLVEKTMQYLQQNEVKSLHIMLLGDAAHGAIHNSCRVASEEDVCDQLMHVAEIIAESIDKLSDCVSEVDVYVTYGNHLRTVQNKDDSVHSDNMEKIIGWWLEQRLKDNNKVHIIKSDYYEFLFLNVCGYNIVGAHGDLEKFKQFGLTVNTLFTKKYGQTIDYTISADKHHIEEFETMGIESTLVRSLCGTDEYSNKNRLYSAPGQTLMIFSKSEGKECTYNIKLD